MHAVCCRAAVISCGSHGVPDPVPDGSSHPCAICSASFAPLLFVGYRGLCPVGHPWNLCSLSLCSFPSQFVLVPCLLLMCGRSLFCSPEVSLASSALSLSADITCDSGRGKAHSPILTSVQSTPPLEVWHSVPPLLLSCYHVPGRILCWMHRHAVGSRATNPLHLLFLQARLLWKDREAVGTPPWAVDQSQRKSFS